MKLILSVFVYFLSSSLEYDNVCELERNYDFDNKLFFKKKIVLLHHSISCMADKWHSVSENFKLNI